MGIMTSNIHGETNKEIANRLMNLDISNCGMTQCMYIWIDGTGEGVRAKTKTVNLFLKTPQNCHFGIMMVAQPVKQRVETPIPTSTHVPSTGILSVHHPLPPSSLPLISTTNC